MVRKTILHIVFASLVAHVGCAKAHGATSNPPVNARSGAAVASKMNAPAGKHHVWTGVWQGTIGSAAIRACFGTWGDPDQGAYYYLRHLSLIALDAPSDSDLAVQGWTERDPGAQKKLAPHWRLALDPDGSLRGTWSAGANNTQPIRLTRAAALDDAEAKAPCGAMSFQRPRIVNLALARKSVTLDGALYAKITADVGAHFDTTIETFALLGSGPAVARINADAAKVLPQNGDAAVADYVDCAISQAASYGENGEYTHTLTPDLLTRHWLAAVETMSGMCGGAHPSAEVDWRVWSLTTGVKVDPWSWFSADAVQRPPPGQYGLTIKPALRKLLVAHWSRDDDCKDIPERVEGWAVHPTREGLAFWPELAHVEFACSDDDVIPYSELRSLMNADGRAAIASIVEDLRSLPARRKPKT